MQCQWPQRMETKLMVLISHEIWELEVPIERFSPVSSLLRDINYN